MKTKDISEVLSDIQIRRYAATYETTTPLLGGSPAEGRIISQEYVEDLLRGRLGQIFDQLSPTEQQEQIDRWKKKSITVFRRLQHNGSTVLAIGGDNIKGALKEAASAFRLTSEIRGLSEALHTGTTCEEWYIPLMRDNKYILKPDGIVERFIPPEYKRPAAVATAECLQPPVSFNGTLKVLSPLLTTPLMHKIAELAGEVGFWTGRKHGHGKAKLVNFRELDGQSRRKRQDT